MVAFVPVLPHQERHAGAAGRERRATPPSASPTSPTTSSTSATSPACTPSASAPTTTEPTRCPPASEDVTRYPEVLAELQRRGWTVPSSRPFAARKRAAGARGLRWGLPRLPDRARRRARIVGHRAGDRHDDSEGRLTVAASPPRARSGELGELRPPAAAAGVAVAAGGGRRRRAAPGEHGLPDSLEGFDGLVLLGGGLMPDDYENAALVARRAPTHSAGHRAGPSDARHLPRRPGTHRRCRRR